MHRLLIASCLALCLAACGGNPPPAPPASTPAAQQEAVSRIGDVTIRATALQTSALAPEIAARYGITRDDGTIMLLVGVRQGPDAEAVALPATVTVTATPLGGTTQMLVLRELRSDGLLDYVGTVETSLPDTLRFDIRIVREGGASSTMQFSREFYPR